MLHSLLKRYNTYRAKKYFSSPLFKTTKTYAFIGAGMHSITNLYPVLQHYHVHLKYICTRSSDQHSTVAQLFPGVICTHAIADILNDNSVEGVFLSATATEHYLLLTQLLQAGKKVFVEKPPCESRMELDTLVSNHNSGVCKVGLQRRYWPGNDSVAKKAGTAFSYNYRFLTGPYVNGDVFTELFIHPVDYCTYLFGPMQVQSFSKKADGNKINVQAHVLHKNSISGLIELSTEYSWNNPIDLMSVNCQKEILSVNYPLSVVSEIKPKRIFGLPAERVLQQALTSKTYFSAGNLLSPVLDQNTLVLQGFVKEIEAFVTLVEGDSATNEANDLAGLIPVYHVLTRLREG